MSGRKTFTAGEVLQAADVNDFLMDQSVMVFAGTAARGSAIPSPSEGMVTYLADSDEVQVYTTDWGAIAGGKILQVVSTTKTDTFSASVAASGGLSGDAMTASITPTDSSSKVLITASLNVDCIGGSGNPVLFLYKDASVLTEATGDAGGSRRRATSGVRTGGSRTSITGSINFLDSPATTSSTTYSVRIAHDSSSTQTVVLNRGGDDTDGANTFRTISTITLTEVAG